MMKHRFIRKAADTPMLSHRPNVAEQKEASLEFVLHRFNRRFKKHASVYSTYHLPETLFSWEQEHLFSTGLTDAASAHTPVHPPETLVLGSTETFRHRLNQWSQVTASVQCAYYWSESWVSKFLQHRFNRRPLVRCTGAMTSACYFVRVSMATIQLQWDQFNWCPLIGLTGALYFLQSCWQRFGGPLHSI